MKTGANLTNDNLSIQQNERIMNHKKKDSNSHLNKFNSAVSNLENNTNLKQENTNYNSAKKYGNSPRELYESKGNNHNANYSSNPNNNNYDLSQKAKRQYDNIIQTQANPYSGVITDNSENLIKSNANKQGNYNSHKNESNNGNNKELFSSAIRFYDSKSNFQLKNKTPIK